jgi:polyhydroxyalkanoate synthesis regulator phasin
MAQSNVLKRYLDAGISFTENTQEKAEALVKDLVRVGEIQAEQAQAAVTELVERSRANTEALITMIRKEIAENAENLGLATLTDLSGLEQRIEDRLEQFLAAVRPTADEVRRAAGRVSASKRGARKSPAKKSTAKKTSAKKTAAKKTAAKKTAAKKTAAKKTAAKKSTAKKTPAKKTPAKKTAAKKTATNSSAS